MPIRISTLALTVLLASSPVLAVGQSNSTKSSNDARATESKKALRLNDNHIDNRRGYSTDDNRKDKKKTKDEATPASSKEDQEFERTLLGIFG